MVRDDDARIVRLDGAALDADGTADREEEQPGGAPRQTPAPLEARHDGQEQA